MKEIYTDTINETSVRYEVWALGYDTNGWCTDIEEFLFESPDKDEAVKFAKNIESANDIFSKAEIEWVAGDYIEIVVETIANNDLSNTNIETVFSKVIPCTEEL